MTSHQEPLNVTLGGMPCRVSDWLAKDYEEFYGPRPWPCHIVEKFYTELELLVRFAVGFEWKQEDKR